MANRYTEIFKTIREYEKEQQEDQRQYARGLLDAQQNLPPRWTHSESYMRGYIKQYDLALKE